MGHRKWMLFGAGAESMEGAMREHNALYDAWVVERDRADDLLKDRNTIQGKLDEARKRIAELESPTRVPFSDAPAGVPSVDPTEDQVEALARVLHKSQDAFYCRYGDHATKFDDHTPLWRTMARAAIAHLSKRPEGLPTAEELAKQAHEIMLQKYPTDYYIPYEDCDSKVIVSRKRFSDAILTALRPWLRDPVGFELDIRPGMLRDSVALHSEESFLKWLRSRIRPVYECREFRQWRKDWDTQAKAYEMLSKAYNAASKQLNAARAALEGE